MCCRFFRVRVCFHALRAEKVIGECYKAVWYVSSSFYIAIIDLPTAWTITIEIDLITQSI